jgi:hypothetical protein
VSSADCGPRIPSDQPRESARVESIEASALEIAVVWVEFLLASAGVPVSALDHVLTTDRDAWLATGASAT